MQVPKVLAGGLEPKKKNENGPHSAKSDLRVVLERETTHSSRVGEGENGFKKLD